MQNNDDLYSILKNILPGSSLETKNNNLSKEDLFKQLSSILCPDIEVTVSEAENIVCNYVYITDVVFKDLKEIDTRIKALKAAGQVTPNDDDYEQKKLRYFAEINEKAKNEIISFLSSGLSKTLIESKVYKYIERKDDGLTMLFLKCRYDYAFFGRYYDPDYDFSTEVKIRFIPGVTLTNMKKTVSQYIDLKKKDPTVFEAKIDRMVSEYKCIEYIRDKIKVHFYLQKRTEIFDTLAELYEHEKYTAFISLAMTQLEGIFYDCITILNKKELYSKAGTLVEKADKVFSENQKVKQAIYPYFAFTVPRLRNEIAHNGITSCDNTYHLCNEIILDIYCMVYWACKLNDDKYIAIAMAYDEIVKVQEKETKDNVFSTTFSELFGNYQVCDREFINVLAEPNKYEKELTFLKGFAGNTEIVTIKEKVDRISNIVKSAEFWNFIESKILSTIHIHESGKPYDVVDFIIHLRNVFIPVLPKDSSEKMSCQVVSKVLKKYES